MTAHRHRLQKQFVLGGAAFLIVAVAIVANAQKKDYSWMELPKKDAERTLANSAWSQIQVDTDASEMFFSPTRPGTSGVGRAIPKGSVSDQTSVNNNRADRGAVNEEINVSYRICFLSARPVRQAFAKVILTAQGGPNDELASQLQAFVEQDYSNFIVIAVTVDANDKRFSGPIMQVINSATTGTLKNSAYLERQDGARLFLIKYLPPIADGLGAKFVFPRLVDGQPFLKSDSGTVRFYAEFSDSFKLNMRYKVSDMILGQKLEY